MASDRLKQLTSLVAADAAILQQLSTQLSEQVRSFEAFLHSLPGKVAVNVQGADGAILYFDRSGNNWRLMFLGPGADRATSLCLSGSVEDKILGIALFEPLLDRLAIVQKERIAQLQEACMTVSRFVDGLGLKPKEGQ